MSENKGIHNGHRKRVKEKFLTEGLDSFCEHQILELLLFYAVPRKDTNELAHKLINSCGSLSAVFDSPIEILQESGLSQNAAVLMKMIPQICRKYMDDKYNNKSKLIDCDSIVHHIMPKFIGLYEEHVIIMLVDAKGKELYCGIVSKGSVNASALYIRKIIELSMKFRASGVILAHNHPSGIPWPSEDDIKTTAAVKKALSVVSVRLMDHIIVADMDYISLSNSEEYFKLFM